MFVVGTVDLGIHFLHAADTAFAHFFICANVALREIFLAEYYVEEHSEDSDSQYEYRGEENFHDP